LDPHNGWSYHDLAWSVSGMNRAGEAVPLFLKAVELDEHVTTERRNGCPTARRKFPKSGQRRVCLGITIICHSKSNYCGLMKH
jgi:hypothetical protein